MVGAEGFKLMNFHFELGGDEVGAVVYCTSDLVLEGFGWVGRGC